MGAARARMGGARVQLGDGGARATPRSWNPWRRAGNGPTRRPSRSRGAATPAGRPTEPAARQPSVSRLSGDRGIHPGLGAAGVARARLRRSAPDPADADARDHAPGRRRRTASSRWARICRSRPRSDARLGYGEVRGCYYGPRGTTDHRTAVSIDGERFECEIDLFDAEKDPFPYPDEHFSTVLCCELIEHLAEDPMHMMAEINRILRPGGHLVLTTPNIASLRAHRRHSAGLPPGLLPRLHPAAGGRGSGSAAQPRVHAARDPRSCSRLPASK